MPSTQKIDQFLDLTQDFLVSTLGEKAGLYLFDSGQMIEDRHEQYRFYKEMLTELRDGTFTVGESKVVEPPTYKLEPVGVKEFLEKPFYLNLENQVYPAIMEEMIKVNSGTYVEALFTGAIGVAKTTMALWTTAYQLYLLSCMTNPQHTFGIDRSSEILFIFQSINATLSKNVNYDRFKALIEGSLYFNKHFPFDKNILSELKFPNRIIIRPVNGAATAAIGQNVIGGIIDELNFMAIVENSKAAVDHGEYDQAIAVYNSIARRRKSRFMKQGKMPGILSLVSSKRYPGQFTDRKEQEAVTDPTIYVYDKRLWDIKPDSFTGETFKLFIGTEYRNARILEDGEAYHPDDEPHMMDVPIEFLTEFQTDMINALRDIAGVSTLATHPFIRQGDKVTECMSLPESIFSRPDTDFDESKLTFYPSRFVNKEEPRWAHLDLSISGDSTGLVIGHVDKFVSVDRGDQIEKLPHIVIDGALEIRPPRGGEINYAKIRMLLYKLRAAGLPIRWVTFDQFQSVDSIQTLRQQGFVTGKCSMDKDMLPYDVTKSALYDVRVEMPRHDRLRRELMSLEILTKEKKIDHPPNGSKDVADALAGVVYGLSVRREIWARHGVPVQRFWQEMAQKQERAVHG